MIVTEAQAAEKLCVQMPVSMEYRRAGSVEFSVSQPTARKCHGSKCMAWRWVDPATVGGVWNAGDQQTGYCGLAGNP